MKVNNKSLNIFQIASAYIGTVVGAGFASGQEVLQFFIAYGWLGLLGIALATLLFFFIGYSILVIAQNLKAKSHVDIVCYTNGKVLGPFIDIIITVFLFGGLAAMIAGAGAIFQEQFSISPLWGMMLMTMATLLTVITGTKGVINAISYVVPFLLVSVLFISITSLLKNPITPKELQTASELSGATPNWLMSAVNYASYNIVVAIAVLTPMGTETQGKKRLLWGALLGALGLATGMAAIYFCILTNVIQVSGMQVPMIEIAGKISQVVKILFAVVLFAEVYTTAVGNLYGFSQRINTKVPKEYLIIGTAFLAFLISQLGFSNMVKYLYPVIGYGGLVFFGGVIYAWIVKKKALR